MSKCEDRLVVVYRIFDPILLLNSLALHVLRFLGRELCQFFVWRYVDGAGALLCSEGLVLRMELSMLVLLLQVRALAAVVGISEPSAIGGPGLLQLNFVSSTPGRVVLGFVAKLLLIHLVI